MYFWLQVSTLQVGILDADIYGPSLPAMIPPSVLEKAPRGSGLD